MVNPVRKICAACAYWEKAPEAKDVLCDTLGACARRPASPSAETGVLGGLTEACDCCEAYTPRG